ncbi:MAG: hypothetical protein VXV96_16735 [Bdellovibrionota bacterium]|nr:hypothetical protein [Bdellovibrionota bacterium]
MKKTLEALREEVGGVGRKVVGLKDFREFLKGIETFLRCETDPKLKAKALRSLIHRIEVSKDELKIYFYVDKDEIKGGPPEKGGSSFFKKFCSNNLTDGGSYWT